MTYLNTTLPISSYYKIAKIIEEDPLFDSKKAQKKLRRYVESNEYAIRHFHNQVVAKQKIGGKARAMVITGNIKSNT
ncbi:MAG: hypothetical protein WC601_02690, partial [Desulfotomaculaceae bacterium]